MAAAMKVLAVKGATASRHSRRSTTSTRSPETPPTTSASSSATRRGTRSRSTVHEGAEPAPDSQWHPERRRAHYLFHFPGRRKECLPFFERVVWLVRTAARTRRMGYWDTLENLCKYYWDVDRQPEKVIQYARDAVRGRRRASRRTT